MLNSQRNSNRFCTIDANVEFADSQYSYVTSINLVFVSDKIVKEVKFYVLFIFCLYTFYLILENISTNVKKFLFFVLFDTCDVVYDWFISLLPPIVLNNLLMVPIKLFSNESMLF